MLPIRGPWVSHRVLYDRNGLSKLLAPLRAFEALADNFIRLMGTCIRNDILTVVEMAAEVFVWVSG